MAAEIQTFTRMNGTDKTYQAIVHDSADLTISLGTETAKPTTGFTVPSKQIWARGKRGTAYLHFKSVTATPVLTAVVNELIGGVRVPIPGARRLVKLSPDPSKLVIPFAMENLHPEATGTEITFEDVTMGGGTIKLDGTLSRIIVEV